MLGRLFALISRRPGQRIDHRNRALAIAMDWDGGGHGPLAPKLRKELPAASSEEIDRLAAECAEAMKSGLDVAFAVGNAEEEFRRQLASRYPWIDEENAARLFRQGLYYAFKTSKAR